MGSCSVILLKLEEAVAGRFGLDVRVTPREFGVESQTQVATAQGEEDLLARMDRVADLVDEQIAGVATARVASVELRGAAGLEGVLGVDVETRVGEVFDPLVLRTDLAALRAHPEVVSAKADSQRGPEGVSVVFDLVLADAGARQQLSPDERIAFVEIRGTRRIASDAIRARIASRPEVSRVTRTSGTKSETSRSRSRASTAKAYR